MFTFTEETHKAAITYNLTEREVIFCRMIAQNIDKGEAYYLLFCHGTKKPNYQQATIEAAQWIKDHPGAAILMNLYKRKAPRTAKEAGKAIETVEIDEAMREKADELQTREGLINFLNRNLLKTTGKEAVTGAQTLAKLQQWDKEDTRTEEERRKFVLPSITRCQNCQLLRIFEDSI